jgi:hypothetical protein
MSRDVTACMISIHAIKQVIQDVEVGTTAPEAGLQQIIGYAAPASHLEQCGSCHGQRVVCDCDAPVVETIDDDPDVETCDECGAYMPDGFGCGPEHSMSCTLWCDTPDPVAS